MRKLKLDLDMLAVESFDAGETGGLGTVRGRESGDTVYTNDQCCLPPSQQPGDNDTACGGTCYQTCNCSPPSVYTWTEGNAQTCWQYGCLYVPTEMVCSGNVSCENGSCGQYCTM